MSYFPGMLDKIRLHARGELHPDFHANLGLAIGADGPCCRFLRVTYAELEWQRDWKNKEHYNALRGILKQQGGAYGVGV